MSDPVADMLRQAANTGASVSPATGEASDDPTANFLRAAANTQGASIPSSQAILPTPAGPSFIDRVKTDYKNRLNEGQQAVDAEKSGKQGEGWTDLDYLGKVGFGTLTDVGGEAIKSAARYAPQGVKDAASSALSYIASTPPGRAAVGTADYLGSQYKDFAQRHPDAARHVEAAANIGGVLAPEIPIKGTSAAGAVMDATKSTGKFVKDAATDLVIAPEISAAVKTGAKDTLKESAAADREAGGEAYRASAAENVQFTPEALTDLKDKLSALSPKSDAEVRVWNKSSAASHVNDLLETMQTEPLTLNGALAQRNSINDSWRAAKRAGKDNEARMLSDVKDALDKTMMNEDTETWQNANHLWAKAAAKQDLADMVASAEGKAQPANSLDTALNKYLNGWKGNTLKPDERAALEDVVNNSAKSELLKSVSGRLINHVATGVGAKMGGLPGAVAGHLLGTYGSAFARDVSMTSKLKKLDAVFEAIDKRAAPEVRKAGQKPMLALPPPGEGASFHVDALGNVSKAASPASEVVNAKPTSNYYPSKAPEKTMGEIARMPPYEAMKYLKSFRKKP